MVANAGYLNKNSFVWQEYVYDFDVSTGAQGAYNLNDLDGNSDIPLGAIVTHAYIKVETAAASGGSATIELGDGSDADKYINATDGALANIDGVNDVIGGVVATLTDCVTATADANVTLTIGAADLTAGKLRVILGIYVPSNI